MIIYLTLLFAIPLGLILASITQDEKEIYSKKPYFPIILWILAITSIIFFFNNKTIALTLTFMFITTLTWNKA